MIRDPTFFAKFSAFGTLTVVLIFATAFYKVRYSPIMLINSLVLHTTFYSFNKLN